MFNVILITSFSSNKVIFHGNYCEAKSQMCFKLYTCITVNGPTAHTQFPSVEIEFIRLHRKGKGDT